MKAMSTNHAIMQVAMIHLFLSQMAVLISISFGYDDV
jgi:hypothetical protein